MCFFIGEAEELLLYWLDRRSHIRFDVLGAESMEALSLVGCQSAPIICQVVVDLHTFAICPSSSESFTAHRRR